ncbi:MAG: hypothetical protein EHM35_19950 [Planctomycetaceae bacterium]|nr:MAG: hypothetical protein EHM35_19950 [Planctomycetaceae bacterium]
MIGGSGTQLPYYSAQSGITGTSAQHAAALRKKQEEEAAASQAKQVAAAQQQQQQGTIGNAYAGYTAGSPSAGAAGTAAKNAYSTSLNTGAGYTVDPTGLTTFNDAAEQQRRTQAEADARRLATLNSLMAKYGTGGREAAPGTVQHRGLSVNADEEAARAAAFARAKDQTGQITRGAVDSLRSLYAGSGNAGAQRQGLENIVAGGVSNLNEFTREQLMSDLAREAEVSDLTYQGGITQRGQDINRPFDPKLQALISLMGTIY